MKDKKDMIKISYKILKLLIIAFLCVFGILVANYYYQIKEHASKLSEKLDIIVFFDESSKDGASLIQAIEENKLISVKEYIDAKGAYLKAVENNPFLKNVPMPDDSKSIQAYALAAPKSIPDEKFIVDMKNALENIHGIDEIVFDSSLFKQYAETEKSLLFYQKVFFIFIIFIFIIFVFKCIIFVMENEADSRKLIVDICSYLLSSVFGFLILWIACIYLQQPLLIAKEAILPIIFFTTAFGVILD